MATQANVRLKLLPPARWLLIFAACSARLGMKIPHRWVMAVVNRSWRMKVGDTWQKVRLDQKGRVV
jgi:hypothetical protein